MTSVLVLSSIIFVAMLSPGPDFLLVVKNSLTRSRREAYLTALGIAFGCLVHATYCILGLAVILKQSVVLFTAIKIAGGCYIAWLGLSLLRSAPAAACRR